MHRSRVERIHHLTIAVPSLERALDLWRDALGVSPDIREFPDHQVREAAFPVGDLEVRLWQSTGDGDSHGDVLRQIGLQIDQPMRHPVMAKALATPSTSTRRSRVPAARNALAAGPSYAMRR